MKEYIIRKTLTAIGAGIAGIGISLAMSPMAHAASTLTASSTNLNDGDSVTVTVHTPDVGKRYYVSVCNGDGTTGNPACDTTDLVNYASFVSTGADVTVSIQVQKEFTSRGSANHPGTDVDCGVTQCYIVAAGHGGGGTPDASALAVSFN